MKITAFNVTVEISYILIAALCTAVTASNSYITAAAILSAALHEAAHIAVMRKFSDDEITVKAGLFNIVINDSLRGTGGYRRDIAVLIAGPAMNAFLCAVFLCIYKLSSCAFCFDVSMVNASLGIFNLLPIETTDGGQLLGVFIRNLFGTAAADRICFALSVGFIIPIATAAICILFESKYNYTMLAAVIYLIAAVVSSYL